jgi:hypothetical protein
MLGNDLIKKIEELSEDLIGSIDDFSLMVFSQRLKLWRENRNLFGINSLEDIDALEQTEEAKNKIIKFVRNHFDTNEGFIVDMLYTGYPSIDVVGLLPLADIASSYCYSKDSYSVPQELGFLDPYLTDGRLISLDILSSFVKKCLHDNERVMHIEYGIGDFTELASKSRQPCIFLTNKRLIAAGNDVAYNQNPSGSANIMLFPGVRTNIDIVQHSRQFRINYPDYKDHQYYGSLDYISFDQIDSVKEKGGAIEIGVKKDFRVLSLSDKSPYNRHLGRLEGEIVKPPFGRKMSIYLVSDRQAEKKMNKSRLEMFKSYVEQAWKEYRR